MLLRRQRRGREQRERQQPALVEEPPGEQQQRARERDRVEVAHGQPLHRREEQVGERERGRRPLGVEVRAREPEDGKRSRGDGDGLDDEQQLRARPEPPERRERGEDRVEVRAQPRDLLAVDVGDREHVAVRGRPDRLRHVPEIEAAAVEGAVAEDGSALKPAAKAAVASQTSRRRRHRARSCSTQVSPPRAEHLLARLRRGRRRGRRRRSGAQARRRPPAAAPPPRALRGRRRAPAAHSLRRTSSSRAAGVSAVTSGVPQASAWNALFGITRPAFAEVPKTPSAQPGALELFRQLLVLDPVDPLDVRRALGQQRVELAAAHDAERDLRREPRRSEDRLDAVERDQLADEERVELLRRLPAGPEEPLLGADEADRQPFGRGARPARRDAARSAAVSATTRSARRSASRSTWRRTPAAGEPAEKRPRSSTSVSCSETSGLKTTGRPRAIRRAAGTSKWPG